MHLSHALSQLGKHDSAMRVSRRAREVDPALILSRTMGARDALAAGDTVLARSLASGIEAPPPWRGQAAFALGKLGDTASARTILRELDKLPRNTWMIHTGTMYTALGLGDTTRALAELEAAFYAGEIVPKWETLADRMFDAVRGSTRFAVIVRAFKLDPTAFASTERR
jgi:hypothetical protein